MKIHLPLGPEHFSKTSSGPLVSIGGDLVLLELQGELHWEGDNADGVVGLLGLDRPDKPTLHLGDHHLLHGKITSLPKPFAVIRKAVAPKGEAAPGQAVQGDEVDEADSELDDDGAAAASGPSRTPLAFGSGSRKRLRAGRDAHADHDEDDEEEDEAPLFPRTDIVRTPGVDTGKDRGPLSSSPVYAPSTARDWSSDLDPSSPYRSEMDDYGFPAPVPVDGEADGEEAAEEAREFDRLRREREGRREQRRAAEKEARKREGRDRTRYYEVVGVVRKKVVFALRPEPIVTATVLPD